MRDRPIDSVQKLKNEEEETVTVCVRRKEKGFRIYPSLITSYA